MSPWKGPVRGRRHYTPERGDVNGRNPRPRPASRPFSTLPIVCSSAGSGGGVRLLTARLGGVIYRETTYKVAAIGRRGARVVEWGGLENRCAFAGTVGSNPTLSAIFKSLI